MKVPKNSGKILTTQEQTSKLEEKSQFSVISKTNRSSQSEQKTEPDKFHNMFHVSQFQTASHVWGCENLKATHLKATRNARLEEEATAISEQQSLKWCLKLLINRRHQKQHGMGHEHRPRIF